MGRGRGAVEKPQDFGGVMKKLVHFCRHYIPAIIVALVLGAICNAPAVPFDIARF